MLRATKDLLTNTIIFACGTIGAKFVMLLLMPIYTGCMTTSELGTAELIVNSMNLIYPLATYNILSALLRYGMDTEYNPKEVFCCSLISILLGLICTGCIIYKWGDLIKPIALWKEYLFLLLVSYAAEQNVAVFAKALGRNIDFAIGNIIYTFILFVFSIILVKQMARGTSGYLESIILSNTITCIFYCVRIKIYNYITLKRINAKLLNEMVVFSTPLIFNSISWWIYSFSDRFILEYFSGINAVGIYSAAAKIPAMITAISSVFMQAWVISAIKEYKSDTQNLFYSSIFEKYSAIMMVSVASLICVSYIIVPLLNKGDFGKSLDYVPFMLLNSSISGISNFFAIFYTSAKKNFSMLVTTVLAALISIICNLFFVPNYAVYGAVFSALIAQLIIMFYRILDTKRFIGFNIKLKRLVFVVLLLMLQSYVVTYCIFPVGAIGVFLIVTFLYRRELIFDIIYNYPWR